MPEFECHGVRGGVWTGRVTASERPGRVCVTARGEVVATARLTEVAGDTWEMRAELPAALISDGVVSLILVADDAPPEAPVDATGQRLGRLTIVAGQPLDGDLEAEIAQLRAELDLLKREFRRLATQG